MKHFWSWNGGNEVRQWRMSSWACSLLTPFDAPNKHEAFCVCAINWRFDSSSVESELEKREAAHYYLDMNYATPQKETKANVEHLLPLASEQQACVCSCLPIPLPFSEFSILIIGWSKQVMLRFSGRSKFNYVSPETCRKQIRLHACIVFKCNRLKSRYIRQLCNFEQWIFNCPVAT